MLPPLALVVVVAGVSSPDYIGGDSVEARLEGDESTGLASRAPPLSESEYAALLSQLGRLSSAQGVHQTQERFGPSLRKLGDIFGNVTASVAKRNVIVAALMDELRQDEGLDFEDMLEALPAAWRQRIDTNIWSILSSSGYRSSNSAEVRTSGGHTGWRWRWWPRIRSPKTTT